jgi:hypothetical protein
MVPDTPAPITAGEDFHLALNSYRCDYSKPQAIWQQDRAKTEQDRAKLATTAQPPRNHRAKAGHSRAKTAIDFVINRGVH